MILLAHSRRLMKSAPVGEALMRHRSCHRHVPGLQLGLIVGMNDGVQKINDESSSVRGMINYVVRGSECPDQVRCVVLIRIGS
jgi:hypothetical protein